jgi:hypothetical protein
MLIYHNNFTGIRNTNIVHCVQMSWNRLALCKVYLAVIVLILTKECP